ncbi:MAG: bacE [Chloroflexi bacterium]|jgi:hypothetical protein|nr:bacE [Chloroflexota bacterium]
MKSKEHWWEAYLKIIHTPGYFPLQVGQLISNFGDTLNYIALVFLISGQGLAVPGLIIFEVIPYILPGSVAGVVIDRVNRKTVRVLADIFRALLVPGLIFVVQTVRISQAAGLVCLHCPDNMLPVDCASRRRTARP